MCECQTYRAAICKKKEFGSHCTYIYTTANRYTYMYIYIYIYIHICVRWDRLQVGVHAIRMWAA